jgi:hypothetical protein
MAEPIIALASSPHYGLNEGLVIATPTSIIS